MDANDLCNKYLKNRLINNQEAHGLHRSPEQKIPYNPIKATL